MENSYLFANWTFSHTIGRIWIDRICRQGSIGDTGQKEGNSEFSFLLEKGEFFHIGSYTRCSYVTALFSALSRYVTGVCIVTGEFAQYADPNRLDRGGQIWSWRRRRGVKGGVGKGGGQVCPTKGSKWRGCIVNTLNCLFVTNYQHLETVAENYHWHC